MPNFWTSDFFLDIYIAFAVDSCPCAIFFTMIELSAAPSAARAQAESSKKCNATAKPASKPKHQTTIATIFLDHRNSTTFLSISKKGLPAPSTSKTHAKHAAPIRHSEIECECSYANEHLPEFECKYFSSYSLFEISSTDRLCRAFVAIACGAYGGHLVHGTPCTVLYPILRSGRHY